jgi:peptide/nickel transport system substrate-binding protein
MTKTMTEGRARLFASLTRSADEGRLDRREFLALSSILGLSMATGIGAIPGAAVAQTPKRGGTLKIGQQILPINDPRVYDWPQKSNVARQFCEPLVRWQPDGSCNHPA